MYYKFIKKHYFCKIELQNLLKIIINDLKY